MAHYAFTHQQPPIGASSDHANHTKKSLLFVVRNHKIFQVEAYAKAHVALWVSVHMHRGFFGIYFCELKLKQHSNSFKGGQSNLVMS